MAARNEDAYKHKYTRAARHIAYRERVVAPGWYHALFIALVCLVTLSGVVLQTPILFGVTLGAIALLSLVWMLFAVMRVHLSPDHLHVKLGMTKLTIATEHIVSDEHIETRDLHVTGWGARTQGDGALSYGVRHDILDAIRITYLDAHGVSKVVVIATQMVDELIRVLDNLNHLETSDLTLEASDESSTHTPPTISNHAH